MRYLAMLLATLVLVGCSTPPATRDQSQVQNAPMNPPVEFLLTSCATDFHTHPPHPVRVRDVRTGYIISPDGARQYMLCGEFLPATEGGKAEWAPFITIKTSGYEQLIGVKPRAFASAHPSYGRREIYRPRCRVGLIPCDSLTIHSSRSRFAAHLQLAGACYTAEQIVGRERRERLSQPI